MSNNKKELKQLYSRIEKMYGIYIERTFAEGRIKRMRSRRESRYVNLAKRVGKKAHSFNSDFCSNLTRWNRH